MLDMGFKPVVDRIVADDPRRPPDAALLGHARGRGRPDRRRLHDRRRGATSTRPRPREDRPHRAPLPPRRPRGEGLRARARAGRPEARAHARLRAHEARRRPARQAARPSRTSHAVAMHGDKSQSQREKALARFESGRVETLVATDVAARGIDVRGITHVINYDAPAAREDYVHRVGRTARAGASGVGITFVMDDQAREVAKFASELGLEHGLGFEAARRGAATGTPRRATATAAGSATAAGAASRRAARVSRRVRRTGRPRPARRGARAGSSRRGASSSAASACAAAASAGRPAPPVGEAEPPLGPARRDPHAELPARRRRERELVAAAPELQVAREDEPARARTRAPRPPSPSRARTAAARRAAPRARAAADPDPRRLALVAREAPRGAAVGPGRGPAAELAEEARRELVVGERRLAAGGRVERPGARVEAARAPRAPPCRPARTSRAARALRPSTAASRSPLTACSSPLRICSVGANEYMT